jgi:2-polyprenyl-6-methoxyphenol hydroxylase-like FAD-dependent oxidoreductase
MESNRQVIIVGAGPGGLTLALALRQAGFHPVVHERAQSGSEAGCGFTLWPNAMRALDVVGVGAELRRHCRPLEAIAMTAADGSQLFSLDSSALNHNRGGIGWAMQRSELIALLMQLLGPDHIRFASELTGFKQNAAGVRATFGDQSEVTGCALIGADGLRSTVRSQLFGEQKLRFAGYAVTRGISSFPLARATGVTSLGRGQQFGYFPMSAERVYWFASKNAAAPQTNSTSIGKSDLLEEFAGWHAPVREVIERTPESCILRNDIYDMDPLPAWTNGRATLLGDAAHPATPDLGQGACQAIEDAIVLARCLSGQTEIGAGLMQYEKHRIRRTRDLTLLARRVGRSGTWTNAFLCGFRNFMIRHTPHSVRLRQLQEMFEFQN